jgi:hypothetical protein
LIEYFLRHFCPALDLTVFTYNLLFYRIKVECHDLFQMLFTLLRYKDVSENEGRDTFAKREGEPDNFAEDDGEDEAD